MLARMWRPPSRHIAHCLYTEKRLAQPVRENDYRAAFCAVAVAIAIVYWDVLRSLGLAWYTDDNYSHGFFIAPLAAYFAWERRAEFTAKPIKPSAFGLVVVAGSLVLLVGGILGAELFISRVSFLGVLTGTILFLYGWQRLRVLAFPAGVHAADDSDSGDHLQPDRVSAAVAGIERRANTRSARSTFLFFARATSSSSRTPNSKSPRRAAAFDHWCRCLRWDSCLAISSTSAPGFAW